MKITNKMAVARYSYEDLEEGDVFLIGDTPYMKISNMYTRINHPAVALVHGTVCSLSDPNVRYRKVDAELILKNPEDR